MKYIKSINETLENFEQKGVTKFNKEIPTPKFEDIWVNGNVVILKEGEKQKPYIVLSELKRSDNDYLYSGDSYPMLINSNGSYYCVSSFKKCFPTLGYFDNYRVKIIKVFKTGINPRTIKTKEDVEKVLKSFEIYCKVSKSGIWDAIEAGNHKTYDAFVDFIKDYYSPNDNTLAYKIEDEVHAILLDMFKKLDKEYL